MKNQYFGDVNDYRKYGLLRALQSAGTHELLVAWMLTPDDGGPDGKLRSYLSHRTRWEHFDPELYNQLVGLLRTGAPPKVSLLERSGILPRASYFSEVVPDAVQDRAGWFSSLLRAASSADFVFLDPDNGIEVPSKPVGRTDSSKYVLWSELERLWSTGTSLIIYQHFPREPRERFSTRIVGELLRRLGNAYVGAFRTKRVLFLVAAQPHHRSALDAARMHVDQHWRSELDAADLLLDELEDARPPMARPLSKSAAAGDYASLPDLKERVRQFCEARDWDQFHGAKDLAIGIITEAAELLEHFRFRSDREVEDLFQKPDRRVAIEAELADVMIFVLRLAQRYEIDLSGAVLRKLASNEERYPVESSRGSNEKAPGGGS